MPEIAGGLENVCDAWRCVCFRVFVRSLFCKGPKWKEHANFCHSFSLLGSLRLLLPLLFPSSLHLSREGRSQSFSGMLTSLCLGPLGDVGRGLDPSPPVSLEPIS